MAILSKAGITSGSVIQPTHVTQIIDALTASGSVIDISVTGSFRVAGTTQLGVLGTSTQSPLVFNPDTSGESVFYIKNPSGALTIGTGGNPYAGSDFITLSSLGVLGLNGNLTVNNTASIGSVFVSGKTGLGTTNPQARLVISNNGSQSIEMDYSVGLDANYIESYNRSSSAPLDLVYYIGSGPTGSHRFFTNGNQRMVVSRDGYVGIGTATPTAPLNVSGDTVITGSTTLFNNGGTLDLRGVNHSYIQWYPDNSTREAYFGFPSSGSQDVVLENENASGGITLKANNGIGINTFTPNATLDVNGDAIITGSLVITNGITGPLVISGSTIIATGSLRVFSPTLSSEIRGVNSINLTSTGGNINLTGNSGVNVSGDLSGGNIYSNRKIRIGTSGDPNRQLEITNSGSLAPTIRLNNTSSNSYYDISHTGNLFINRNASNSGLVITSGSGGGSTVFATSSITLEAGVVDSYTTTNFGPGTYILTYAWNGGDDINIRDGSPTGSVIHINSYGTPPLTSSFIFTSTTGFITFTTEGFTLSQVNFSSIIVSSLSSNIRVGINKASGSVVNATGLDISGSLVVSGSTLITDVLTLPPVSPLPSGRPTGSLAVSGSGANCKVYFFNGSWNALF